MNPDFTFGPDRTICLAESEEGEYRITVARRPDTGLEVFLEVPVAGERADTSSSEATELHEQGEPPTPYQHLIETLLDRRCGRLTRKGLPCQTRVATAGRACHRHRHRYPKGWNTK
jgi:hypothetical protein